MGFDPMHVPRISMHACFCCDLLVEVFDPGRRGSDFVEIFDPLLQGRGPAVVPLLVRRGEGGRMSLTAGRVPGTVACDLADDVQPH